MQLLLLIVLFIAAGYMLAGSDFSEKVDATSVRASSRLKRSQIWLGTRFRKSPKLDDFRAWVNLAGADMLPDEFVDWFGELADEDAQGFVNALADYSDGLGYNLALLVAGGLEQKPLMKQVFVEAIVVYSDAYRKAREAREKEEQAEKERQAKAEKQAAKKQPSRRKREPVVEAVENASAA